MTDAALAAWASEHIFRVGGSEWVEVGAGQPVAAPPQPARRVGAPAGSLRPMTSGDVPACAALYTAIFNGPPWHDAWTVEMATARLAEIVATPGFVGLVYTDPDPIGFVLGSLEQWHDGRHFGLKEMGASRNARARASAVRCYGT